MGKSMCIVLGNTTFCVNYRTYVKESDVVSGIQPETKPLNDHLSWSSVEVSRPLPKTKMLSFFFTTWIQSTIMTLKCLYNS